MHHSKSTLKNNLGKYLHLAAREEVIITGNGRKIARLSAYEDSYEDSYEDRQKNNTNHNNELVREQAEKYETFPRKASYEEFLELSIYLFDNNDIKENITYKNQENAISYHFPGLEINLAKLFNI